MRQPVHITWRETRTDGTACWIARCEDTRGLLAHGDTPDDALASLAEAHALVNEHAREHGLRQLHCEHAVTAVMRHPFS